MSKICIYGMIVQLSVYCLAFAVDSKAQNKSVNDIQVQLDLKNPVQLEKVFEQIERSTGFHFSYADQQLNSSSYTVSLDTRKIILGDLLMRISKQTELSFRRVNDHIFISKKELGIDRVVEVIEQVSVTGKVSDENGEGLPGATVLEKSTSNGTITDLDGTFSLTVSEEAVLTVSFVGFKTIEVPVNNRSNIDISLTTDFTSLEEVVVVGYGTQKKANLTGAVDQVSEEVLENRALTNLTQGLQGVMPNLNIKMLDGKPNQAPSYNIRGTTSIGQGGNALVLIDGVEGDPSLLNPYDIESVSLLKDAASAAIYGARGTFGVVLITTKNPKKGKTTVNYSGNYSFKNPVVMPDYVWDGYTWAKMFNEATINWEGSLPSKINKTMRFSQEYLEELKYRSENPNDFDQQWEINPANGEYVYYYSTDFYDELYKDFMTAQDHNVTISGSSENAGFMVSGRYFGQDGIFQYNSDDYRMINFRTKGHIQIYPWLKIDNNTQYSNMDYHNPMNVGEGSGIWRNIADEGFPMSPMFNPDGTLTHTSVYNVGDFWYGKNGIDFSEQVFRSTTGLSTQFFDNKFRVKGNFTFQNSDDNEKRRRVPVPYDKKPGETSYVGTTTNDLRDILRQTQYLASNLYSEYENTFGGGTHYFKAMVGMNYEQSTYRRNEVERNGLIFEDAIDISLALGQDINVVGGYEQWNIFGGFSRLNYSFKDRYLFEVNARYDGSSKFPENERYGFFPSISTGWRISNESFWGVSEKFISNLKIRASYGSLGNGNIASYVYQEQFSISQSDLILGGVKPQTTSRPTVLPDGLTWETSTTTNVGLDFAMLSDKLLFVGDMYLRKTTDMFTIGRTLPAVFGATPPKGNYADLETKGWEASLSWRDNFKLKSEDFNYNIRLILADNKTVITKYNNPEKDLNDYYEGMVVGEIWGYNTLGFFRDQADIDNHADQSKFKSTSWGEYFPGDIKLEDTNGDGSVDPGTNRLDDPGDRSIIGNSAPRYTFGINLGVDWNGFFFSSFFQGVGKQDWWPSREASVFWGKYNRPYNPLPRWHLDDHWTPENTDAYLPRFVGRLANRSGGILREAQTRYLQNIAYIRLKNIQFGYNLPDVLVSRIKAENVRVYLSGENLWTWSPLYKVTRDLDVENTGPSDQLFTSSNAGDGYNYPMMKSVSLGLSVTF
ncbi:MAG: SusC/RagA family TonB-linked outer membrane protein [Bacteroidota bacterium]